MPGLDTSLAWTSDCPALESKGTVAAAWAIADDYGKDLGKLFKLDQRQRPVGDIAQLAMRMGRIASHSPMAWRMADESEFDFKPRETDKAMGAILGRFIFCTTAAVIDVRSPLRIALHDFYSVANVTDVYISRDQSVVRVSVWLLDETLPDELLESLVKIEAKILSPEPGLYLDFEYLPKAEAAGSKPLLSKSERVG